MMWRRKKSIVNPKYQIWFSLELIAVTIGFLVICAFLIFVPPMSDIIPSPIPLEPLLQDLTHVILIKWPMIIAAFLVLLIIGLLMSHRLWGPLYGLDRVLASWEKGDRTARVRFRKYDYLVSSKDAINLFLDRHERLISEATTLAKEAQDAASDGSHEVAKEKLQALTKLLGGEPKDL